MEVTRPIASIPALPSKRDGDEGHLYGRKNLRSGESGERNEKTQDLPATHPHVQSKTVAAANSASVPTNLREIQPTFTSNRGSDTYAHLPYSSQFLAQQLGQQDEDIIGLDPTRAHGQATAAYNNSLGLTVTVLGFDGHAERIV